MRLGEGREIPREVEIEGMRHSERLMWLAGWLLLFFGPNMVSFFFSYFWYMSGLEKKL